MPYVDPWEKSYVDPWEPKGDFYSQYATTEDPKTDEVNSSFLGDTADLLQRGASLGIGGVLDFVGADDTAQEFYDFADKQLETLSPDTRQAMEAELVSEEGDFYMGKDAGNARAWLAKGIETLGMMAVPVPGGAALSGVVRVGLGMTKAAKALAKTRKVIEAAEAAKVTPIALAKQQVANSSKFKDWAATTIGYGGAEGASAAGLTEQQVREQINSMPIEKLAESQPFQQALQQTGGDQEAARQLVANTLSKEAAIQTFGPTALLGAGAGRFYDNILRGVGGSSRVVNALKGGITEAAEEMPQSAVEQMAQNRAVGQVDPSVGALDNVGSNVVAGGILGGATGGIIGGAMPSGRKAKPIQEATQTEPVPTQQSDINQLTEEQLKSQEKDFIAEQQRNELERVQKDEAKKRQRKIEEVMPGETKAETILPKQPEEIILRTDKKPFKDEASAQRAKKARKLPDNYRPVQIEGGYGLQPISEKQNATRYVSTERQDQYVENTKGQDIQKPMSQENVQASKKQANIDIEGKPGFIGRPIPSAEEGQVEKSDIEVAAHEADEAQPIDADNRGLAAAGKTEIVVPLEQAQEADDSSEKPKPESVPVSPAEKKESMPWLISHAAYNKLDSKGRKEIKDAVRKEFGGWGKVPDDVYKAMAAPLRKKVDQAETSSYYNNPKTQKAMRKQAEKDDLKNKVYEENVRILRENFGGQPAKGVYDLIKTEFKGNDEGKSDTTESQYMRLENGYSVRVSDHPVYVKRSESDIDVHYDMERGALYVNNEETAKLKDPDLKQKIFDAVRSAITEEKQYDAKQPAIETGSKSESSQILLPAILNTTEKRYVSAVLKKNGIKKESPGYDAAVERAKARYETEQDKAYASLPLEEYNRLNPDSSEDMNRQVHAQLQEEYGVNPTKPKEKADGQKLQRQKAAKEVAEQKDSDQRSVAPVAESQAPETSEPGDRGVAPTQESASPKSSKPKKRTEPKKDDGDVMFSRSKEPVFYSELTKQVELLKQPKAPALQWKAMINKLAQKGVKQEEIAWSGVEQWLDEQKGPVTKEALVDYLRSQEVQIEEVTKGNTDRINLDSKYAIPEVLRIVEQRQGNADEALLLTLENDDEAYRAVMKKFPELEGEENWAKIVADDVAGGTGNAVDTKYSQYQMPGESEGYRELLLTLPLDYGITELPSDAKVIKKLKDLYFVLIPSISSQYLGSGKTAAEAKADALETLNTTVSTTKNTELYKSSHWDEPNVLAHIRFNEREIDGKSTLFVEESQSDWAQQGRRKGFGKKEIFVSFDKNGGMRGQHDTKEEAENRLEEIGGGYIETQTVGTGVPDMPFKKTDTWAMLAMKRMIRYAAENGFDQIAWTPGEVQAERYDLSKQIKEINYSQNGDNNYNFQAIDHSGNEVIAEEDITLSRIEELAGKEIAEKIKNNNGDEQSNEEGDWRSISGIDLKVGGEGMRGFYDQILPNAVQKYVKKFGAKVGTSTTTVPRGKPTDYADFNTWENTPESEEKVIWTVPVTENMRESAMKGFPMFSKGKKGKGMPRGSVLSAVAPIAKTWKQSPSVVVVDSMDDTRIPAVVRNTNQRQMSQGAKGTVEGFIHGDTVYLVASNIKNEQHAAQVLMHEALGHAGLRGVFGDKIIPILDQIALARPKEVAAKAKKYGLDMNNQNDRRSAAEEVLAALAETRPEIGFVRRAIAIVRSWLRKNVPYFRTNKITDDEIIQQYILPARRFIEKGGMAAKPIQAETAYSLNKPETRQEKQWTDTNPIDGMPAFTAGDIDLVPVGEIDNGQTIEDEETFLDEIPGGFSENGLMGHASKAAPGSRTIKYQVRRKGIPVASLVLDIKDGQVITLHDIEVITKGQGDGEAIVSALAANAKKPILIADITNDAEDFWVKMGVGYINHERDARLDWQGYNRSRNGQPGENAPGDTRGATEQRSQGRAQEAQQEGDEWIEGYLNKPKFSLGEEEDTEASFETPGEITYWDKTVTNLVDRFNSLSKIQKKIGEVPEEQDADLAVTMYPGRARARIDEFTETSTDPLVQKINDSGISFEDVGKFLHARYAKEANTLLKKRNPNRKDNDALSGMTNEEAEAILKEYADNPFAKDIAAMVDTINQDRVKMLVKEGLLTQSEADAWQKGKEHYVPLHRKEVASSLPKTGRGFDIRGKESKFLAGSTKEVDHKNMVVRIIAQSEASMVRAEKNKVAQTVFQLADSFPNPEVWSTTDIPQISVRATDGTVRYQPNVNDTNVLAAKFDGETKYVYFKPDNQHANQLVRVLKNLDGKNQGAIVNALSRINRVLAMVNTSLSPEFVISNFFRDVQTAVYNLTDTEAADLQGRIIKDVPKALAGIRSHLRGDKSHEWAKEFDEFRKAGGMTGWIMSYDSVGKRMDTIKRELFANSTPGLKQFMRLGKLIEDYNTIVENGVRMSAFVNARKAGLSTAKAARIAKELTVNFNRKGEWGTVANAMYLFYNASIQGTARLLRGVVNPKNTKLHKMVVATVVASAVLDILNRIAGGEDDDGESLYDKIPDHVKDRNLIIMDFMGAGGDESGIFFKLPLPWGFNIFHVIGQEIGGGVSYAMGDNPEWSAIDGATRTLGSTLEAFNPTQDGSLLQTLSPTVIDPFVRVAENKDWHGGPLYPNYNPSEPNFRKFYSSARSESVSIAEWMHEATLNPETMKSSVDLSPEWIDMMYDFITGSAGRVIADTVGTTKKLTTGGEFELKEIPIARKLAGNISAGYKRSQAYDAMYSILDMDTELRKRKGDPDYLKFKKGVGKRILLINPAKTLRKQLKNIKKIKKIAEDNGDKEGAKKAQERMDRLMATYTKRYRAVLYGR